MPYKPESFAEILCWREDTEIQYVPFGKKAGTKSYDRYVKYSQGKTVGQALEFGSLPLDLVNDLERKLLKRVGGPVREKPLNLLDVEDPTKLSKTDLIIARWGYQLWKKENGGAPEGADAANMSEKQSSLADRAAYRKAQLSAQYGLKAGDIVTSTGWAESSVMIAKRTRANKEASTILEEAAAQGRKIADDDVLRVLRLWAVRKNMDRKNVFPEGQDSVLSETIGLLHCSGGRLIATLHTKQYPKVLLLLTQWLKDNRPEGHDRDFPFTSICVNSSYAARRHRDHLNTGPTIVKAFGDFNGGTLKYWEQDNKTNSLDVLKVEDAVDLDVRNKLAVIDGNRAHAVEEYTGEERFSLVFFTTFRYDQASAEVKQQLVDVGIPFPDAEAQQYAKSLLPAAGGYAHLPLAQSRQGSGLSKAERISLNQRKKAEDNKAISFLKGLRSLKKGQPNSGNVGQPKKGLLFSKMVSMRAAASKAAPEAEGDEDAAVPDAAQNPEQEQAPVVRAKGPKPLVRGGLLGRVLGKRLGDKAVIPKISKVPVAKAGPRKLVAGGLLARVQKQAQALSTQAEEATPESPVVDESEEPKSGSHEEKTPAKRPREDSEASEKMALSGKKSDAPIGLKREMSQGKLGAVAVKVAEPTAPPAKVARQEPRVLDESCQHFLKFAEVLSAAAGDVSEASDAVAESLKAIAHNAPKAKDALHAAMILMEPTEVVPARLIASAISAAFGVPCAPTLVGEALAAKALEGRQRKMSLNPSTPISIIEVAHAVSTGKDASDESEKAFVDKLAKTLEGTQIGMEPFFVVRALQGKLAPTRDVVQHATAKAMSQLVGR